ncbi:MAG: ATP-binding cassette domain-containing protein [Bacteroidales bacterium]|jgi:ABC-type lipoprotein export system ATPase subunit|nr:ATP-binding cassette domain-containing protein [Bacteroidales bacterium]
MESIRIHHVLPYFLPDAEASVSEIWRRDACFRKGERHLVSATSGAGKSSLLGYLFGERSDYTGDIRYDDREIGSLTATEWSSIRQCRISFVFQGLRLFTDLTAFENIDLKNRLSHHKTGEEILYLLNLTGLADKRDEKVARLSFGQQQRIAIIRALCQPFDFLLMDEPFSHLDDANVEIISRLVEQELSSKQAGLILCSLGAEYPFTYHHKWKL